MTKMSYKSKLATLILVTTSACATKWQYPEFPEESVKRVRIIKFDDYDPKPESVVLEELPESFAKYLAHYGLRETKFLDEGMPESVLVRTHALKNKRKLLEAVINDLFEWNITPERASSLTPREAVEVSCALATTRLTPDLSNEEAKRLDGLKTDEVYLLRDDGETPAVCRHYSRTVSGVFRALREINPGIRNTFITVYYNDHRKHQYNQVTTINGEEMTITFVDASRFATRNKEEGEEVLDAITEKNFGEKLEGLEKEKQYLERKMPGTTITTNTANSSSPSQFSYNQSK